MATGFKQATVNASDVPATQTDYPAYVDLSRLGITTLAEAQSVRCYSDSAKTIELAREIVSVSEMHVKVSSLTSTFVLYVDWDGSRADYAAGDTYGRNAVWNDYEGVWHFQSDATDSSGTNSAGTVTNATNTAFGIGNGYNFDGTNDKITLNRVATIESQTQLTMQMRHRPDVITSVRQVIGKNDIGSGETVQFYWQSGTVANWSFNAQATGLNTFNPSTVGITAGNTYFWHFTFNGANASGAKYVMYVDGVSKTFTQPSPGDTDTGNSTLNVVLGERSGGTGDLDGAIDEVRFRIGELSANWITTEYNNHSDEAGFWGTWTDVPAGSAFLPRVTMY